MNVSINFNDPIERINARTLELIMFDLDQTRNKLTEMGKGNIVNLFKKKAIKVCCSTITSDEKISQLEGYLVELKEHLNVPKWDIK